MEGNLIFNALRENKWNRRKAALALNISYRALIYKIREAGLSPKRQGNRPQMQALNDSLAKRD
jgi:two-component system, NtrC family, response regulator AtoC